MIVQPAGAIISIVSNSTTPTTTCKVWGIKGWWVLFQNGHETNHHWSDTDNRYWGEAKSTPYHTVHIVHTCNHEQQL